jgi:hypothetical protein
VLSIEGSRDAIQPAATIGARPKRHLLAVRVETSARMELVQQHRSTAYGSLRIDLYTRWTAGRGKRTRFDTWHIVSQIIDLRRLLYSTCSQGPLSLGLS